MQITILIDKCNLALTCHIRLVEMNILDLERMFHREVKRFAIAHVIEPYHLIICTVNDCQNIVWYR